MKIWKYHIPIEDEFKLEVPEGTEILCVQTQYGQPCIWCAVPETEEKEIMTLRVHGTGHPINDEEFLYSYDYIGTFQVYNGDFVGHLFRIWTIN